ncbi:uncharacterized protein K452DRAFT_236204 [Aplosporella prunicola CBS 121167]|uniref:Carrier domain-containing protein n=1 Tax=Aplosporella prunicola CBS 121167 TaxID=1176127 RepID=A0A6A6B1G2_9PEZI|nr:uncharacterized protein K452DRAFT_236204 [Aplosporella prunicola CBS 121167]KAF2137213.1 hypothetical protein K452DRAFT_236204 [Aplosporella prunicola CBS 121167]
MGSIAGVSNLGFSPFADKPLTHRIDGIAAADPSRVWVTVPTSNDLNGAWRDITFSEFAGAINGAAKWIEKTMGVGEARETVAYMGVNDVRYAVIICALMKTNRKALLLSLKNSEEGQTNLLQRTECSHFLHSEGMEKYLKPLNESGIPGYQIPTFDEMVSDGSHYEAHGGVKEFEQVLVLHTSGSTGLPKPIYITNGWMATLDHQKYIRCPDGRLPGFEGFMKSDTTALTMLPFFHTMGVIIILRSVYSGTLVLPPLGRIANSELAIDILQLKKASCGLFAPSMLEEISETQRGLDALGSLEFAYFGGAPLAKEAGDRITKVTNLNPVIGSTEAGLITSLLKESKEDWQYFEWHPNSGVVMEDAGEGLKEQLLKPITDPKYLGVFYTFPELSEWRTKDLWEQHPTKPALWRYKGRRDDVIVFSNGEKFNPVSFEKTVENHPLARGAVVVGQGRFQPAVIIEPDWAKVKEDQDASWLLEELWPAIEEANREAPAHGQVWKSKVAFTKRDKPFARAPKGSIQRKATIALYEQEIEALYSSETFDEKLGKLDKNSDLLTTKAFLRQAFGLALPPFQGDVTDDTDIFDLGVDSLQVMALAGTLSHAIKGDGENDRSTAVVPREIYSNPTVNKLAVALLAKFSKVDEGPAIPREQVMTEMIKKYTEDLPQSAAPLPALPEKETVLLTGSTGSLGNYVLETLIASPSVEKVYCLNRSDSAEKRQAQSFTERDVPADFSKVTFLRTDFSQPRFGLSQEVYDELAKTATTFIHNAWAVDFNHTLESYEPTHIAGTRRVVDFSLQSQHRAHIVFISSIASVGNWPTLGSGPVPERFFEDERAPLPQGYGESKHVAGRILGVAAQQAGVPASIIRCGQLAGPRQEKGCWNRHEWLPSIVHTSKNMGMVPANLGNQDIVDWVPMDAAAGTVVQVTMSRNGQRRADAAGTPLLDVFHIVNPRTCSWNDLVPVIQAFYTDAQPKAVKFDEWMVALKAVPLTDAAEVARKPGVKIIDFYEGLRVPGGALPPMETTHTTANSECLRELKAVDAALFTNWMKQWGF